MNRIFYIICLLVLYASPVTAMPIQIEVHGLKVIKTKPNGAHWDTGFGAMILPDLLVRIYQNKKLLWSTAKISNRYESARIFISPPLSLNEHKPLVVEVIDKDLRADDLIERFTFKLEHKITAEPQKVQLSGKSVISCNVLIRSIKAPEP